MAVKKDAPMQVQHILCLIARSIVDEPEKVRVDAESWQNETRMHLHVASRDLSAIIGPDGNVGDSLRDLLTEFGAKHKHQFALDIEALPAN